ncbi:MAG: cell division protein ZapA [Gemmatimonadaceae bacterium]|nr:cell division protein ZapA [Chitinophagaceae bacterium]
MDELIPVNVLIGDRTYRVKVLPKDEEVVRKTIKFINDKIIEFKTQFAGKDMQDYLGMVVLWYATQQQEDTANLPAAGELQSSLERLEGLIDKAL